MIEKRGRGRPKAGLDKKTKMICFWTTSENHKEIHKAAKFLGVRVAQLAEESTLKRVGKILKE